MICHTTGKTGNLCFPPENFLFTERKVHNSRFPDFPSRKRSFSLRTIPRYNLSEFANLAEFGVFDLGDRSFRSNNYYIGESKLLHYICACNYFRCQSISRACMQRRTMNAQQVSPSGCANPFDMYWRSVGAPTGIGATGFLTQKSLFLKVLIFTEYKEVVSGDFN